MPGAPWLTPTQVSANAEAEGSAVDTSSAALVNATNAARAWVETKARPDLDWTSAGFTVPADVLLGAMMLAWRWYQRRSAPLGVMSSGAGEPVEMLREDPDIAKLLGIGPAGGAPFVFGAGIIPRPGEYGYVPPVAP